MRLALAGLVLALAVAALVILAGADPDRETAPSVREPPRAELLMRTPRGVMGACRSATSMARMPPHCPSAIPLPDGAWGRARALDSDPCEYLVDVEPGTSRDESAAGPIFHLMFGGRCGRVDLATHGRRWPNNGFFANDLRLVGVAPLKPGQSSLRERIYPARPHVLARMRIDGRPALLLTYPANSPTTVHQGHFAIVWNEAQAAYVVSGHPSDPRTARKGRRTVRALRAMAVAMHALD